MDSTTIITVQKDGFVELISANPSENTERAIVRSARVSYNRDLNESTPQGDANLIDFLIENVHTSPLEMVQFTFHLKVPLSIATQILRHRTASVNCLSHRYSKAEEGWYVPVNSIQDIRYQSELNRQVSVPSSSNNDEEKEEEILSMFRELEDLTQQTYNLYEKLLERGVAREQARFYLPCGTYTRMYWSMDLHNLLHFLKLRLAPDAQYEVRLYAEAIYTLIKPFVPNVIASYEKYILKSILLNADEIKAIQSTGGDLRNVKSSSLSSSKRKQLAFAQKLNELF